MEEPLVKIKKIITTLDNEKSYSIDVDESTTFYEFKKILASAAHLLKNCFRLYLGNQEYTNDYDDNTLQEMFPDLDPVPLRIISDKDVYEFEDELISVRFNINIPCNEHIGKYKMLYCFSCNKSICTDCFSQNHRGHKIEEKADYLAPAHLLMNNIFSNSSLYKADSRLSKYMESITFRSNLKLNIFDNLRKMINDLEYKFASCLEYFSITEDETEKNTNANLELLKKFCTECFIKLKNDINTKGIIIDDEIFLTVYYKLKEIERYKNEYFEENKLKYEKINTLLAPFIKQIEKISEELKAVFDNYLNKDIYDNFKNLIQENIVEKIQKETVNELMFRNIGVPRKSLNRMSLGNVTSYKKRGRNNFISPDKVVNNQKKDQNPFQRANLSAQPQTQATGSLFGYNSSNNAKSERQNNFSNLTWSKIPEINSKSNEASRITKKNEILVQGNSINSNNMTNINLNGISGNMERKLEKTSSSITRNFNNTGSFGGVLGNDKRTIEENVTTTSINNIGNVSNVTGINSRNIEDSKLTSINTGGINIKSVLTNNNNLNLNTNNNTNNLNFFNKNAQKETTTVYQTSESVYPIQNNKNLTQQDYNINQVSSANNLNEIHAHKLGQMNQNITKTETIVTTTTTNNLSDQNKLFNSNNITNNNRNDSHYSQGYEIVQYSSNNQQNIKQSGEQQVSSSNLFKGDLISVLNNEINKNQQELQEKSIVPQVNESHYEQTLYGLNGEVVHHFTKTQKVEYTNGMIPSFLFMYPVFGENKIIGALEDESTGKMNVDFKQAFGEKDIQLNEFPEGGAFCNRGKYLYCTGGQEKLKGIGKLFLRAFLQPNDYKIILVKMPPMIYTHWNHSMIANDNYIFVIGGYNSNKCECFNLETMKWEPLPDLNSEERQRPMLVIYKDYLYAFMGHTQFNILDTIERINITKLKSSKWEKVAFSNPRNINSKFYEAGIYNHNGELFFIGGKTGLGNNEIDYKKDIYIFNFDGMILNALEMCYGGPLSFIETEFHKCNEENIGNFIDLNGGSLATIAIDNLFKND